MKVTKRQIEDYLRNDIELSVEDSMFEGYVDLVVGPKGDEALWHIPLSLIAKHFKTTVEDLEIVD